MKYEHLLNKLYDTNGYGPDKFSCWGLCKELLKDKYDLPKFEVEDDEVSILKEVIANNIDSVVEEIKEPEEGCLVTFWIRPPYTSHIGIVTKEDDGWYFIHVLKQSGVTKERLYHPLWKKRITGFYRIRDKYAK